jgi:hypothetical protein
MRGDQTGRGGVAQIMKAQVFQTAIGSGALKLRFTLSVVPNTKPFGLSGALACNRSSSNARRIVIATCLFHWPDDIL